MQDFSPVERQGDVCCQQSLKHVIRYDEDDRVIHDDSHPFCSDETCPCHDDKEAWHRECGFPVLDGLMTESEASRLFYGKQL